MGVIGTPKIQNTPSSLWRQFVLIVFPGLVLLQSNLILNRHLGTAIATYPNLFLTTSRVYPPLAGRTDPANHYENLPHVFVINPEADSRSARLTAGKTEKTVVSVRSVI